MIATPRVSYGAGPTLFTFTLPCPIWTPDASDLAGHDEGPGARAAYVIRHDSLVGATLRFTRAEWTNVEAWLQWALANWGSTFGFRFNATDAATDYTVYLERPVPGDRYGVRRDEGWPVALAVDIEMRNSAAAPFLTSPFA